MKIPQDSRTRTLLASGTSVALVAIVSILVLTFGMVSTPSFPPADNDDPALTGRIAVVVNDYRTSGSSCVHVINAVDKSRMSVDCGGVGGTSVAWTRTGTLLVARSSSDTLLPSSRWNIDEWDVSTQPAHRLQQFSPNGNPVNGNPFGITNPGSPLSSYGQSNHRNKVDLMNPDTGERLSSIKAPSDYSFSGVHWSADRKSLVVLDSESRVLIANSDGRHIRLLTSFPGTDGYLGDAGMTWWQPGQVGNTVDIEEVKRGNPNSDIQPMPSESLTLHEQRGLLPR